MIDGMDILIGMEKQIGKCLNNGEGEEGIAGITQKT